MAMRLKVKTGKIVGRSSERVWGQVFQSDSLFLVIEVTVPEDFEAAPLGKEIIETLSSRVDTLSEINLQTLKSLLVYKKGAFLDLKIPKRASVNLLLCVLIDSVFYLVSLGQGKASLKRGEKFAVLLEREGGGSGWLEEGDLLILVSSKFSQIVTSEVLKANLNDLPPSEIAENLAPLVHAQENIFGAAALILKFQHQEEKIKEAQEAKEEYIDLPFPFKEKLTLLKEKIFKLKPGFTLRGKPSESQKTKKMVLTVALVLIGLLVGTIFFGSSNREKSLRSQKLQAVLEEVTHQYEEGKALLPLNTQKSRELLRAALESLEKSLPEFKLGSSERKKLEKLLAEIENVFKETEKVYKVSETPLFFDPVFLKDKAFGEKLGLYKDSLVILDQGKNTLYFLTVKEKSGKILAGGEELEAASQVGIHGDQVYTLAKEGVIVTDVKTEESTVIIKEDDDWGEITDLVSYRGNVYLLDKKGEIIKYLRTDEGLGKRSYLAADVVVDFSSTTSMAIDGEIWVASKGQVLRFSLGARKEFSVKGLDQKLGDNLIIYTDEEAENLYLLDKSNDRIVVLNKEGEYQAQYEWEKLGEADDLVVSESEKKILVLVEGKIYGIEIK